MTPQLANVANAFHVGSLVLGVPSFIALLPLSFYAIQMRLSKAPAMAPAPANEPVSLVSLLVSGARVMGKVASFMGDMAQAFVTGLAILALVLTLVAVAMFYTSRGLQAGATWARVVAIAITIAALCVSLVGSLALRLPVSLAMYALFAASLYAMWALTLRFSA